MGDSFDRRRFLTSSLGLVSVLILDASAARNVFANMAEDEANRVGILVRPSQCIGCMACVEACEKAHGETGTFYTNVVEVKELELFVPTLCMHCKDAPCAKVCLTGAIGKLESGPVVIDQGKCIGCTLCASACPFNRIHYDQSRRVAFKCDMCYGRISRGMVPACVEVCPVDPKARFFGTYKEILDEAIKFAEKMNGLIVYQEETSTLYVVERRWLEKLKDPPIKLGEEYPQAAKLLADASRYSRWAILPIVAGVIGYAVLWRKEKVR